MKKTVNEFLSGRDNNFDFIRFCAALAVIFSHTYNLTRNSKDPLSLFSDALTSFGSLSVSIFFIISGILIAQSFDRTSKFVNFVEARILRIYPALIVTIIITVFVIGPLMTVSSLKTYFTDTLTWKYLINIAALRIQYHLPGVFETNPFPNAVNGSLWTLPLELGCYWLVASVLSFSNKKYFQSILLGIVVLLLFKRIFINVNTFYFALGTVIYMYRSYIRITTPIALVCALGFAGALTVDMNQIVSYTVLGITTAYLTLYLGFVRTTYLKNFSKYGDFSYGLYIWAFPIQQIVASKLPSLSVFNHFLLSSMVTLLFSVASWHLIEKQALKMKKQFNYKSILIYVITISFAKKIDNLILNYEVKRLNNSDENTTR